MQLSIRQTVNGGFALAVILLTIIGAASYWSTRKVSQTASEVERTHALFQRLGSTRSDLQDVETGARGYVITGDTRYLEPYNAAAAEVMSQVKALRGLIADDPRQQDRLDALAALVAQRIALADEAVTLRRDQGFEAAQRFILTGQDKSVMDDIRGVLRQMFARENDVLRRQNESANATAVRTRYIVILGGALAVAVVAFAIVSINRQMDQRRRAVEELGRFFTLSLDMLCVAGFDGYFKRLNPAWEQTLGFTTTELRARPYIEFVHPDDREPTLAEAQKLSVEGVDTISFHNRYLCKDGSYKWIEWKATPFAEREAIYAAARDMTDQKQAEAALKALNESLEQQVTERTSAVEQRAAELARSNAELEAFTYSVSHDLKEPLRTLEAFSQFLLEDYAEQIDEQGRDYLHKLSKASARMKHQVDDLLTLSRVGRQVPSPACVDVGAAAADIVEGMRFTIDAKHAIVEIQDQLPPIVGDAPRVEQIFGNLIANALKFNASAPPCVRVGMRSVADGMATFYVEDNGIGIDPQYQERIFGIFQRLQRREEYEGTGAGLAIVKRAVEALGGRIWVESEPGAGATFLFTLPVWSAGVESAKPKAA